MHSKESFSVIRAGFNIQADLFIIGKDLLIAITGGDHPHVGTVTTYTANGDSDVIRYPSQDGRQHKDDYISEKLLHVVGPYVSENCTVVSGVHVDGITKEQVEASGEMAENLGRQIAEWLKQNPIDVTEPKYFTANEQPR